LGRSAKRAGIAGSLSNGFSILELVVSLAVLFILTAIAIPSLMQSLRSYQLNDVASRLADIVKFTRFEAVRRNAVVPVQIKSFPPDWVVWADADQDGNLDAAEKQILITGIFTLLPAGGSPGLPSPASFTGLGASGALTPLSGANGSVLFDARGALSPLSAYVFYVGSAAHPEFGFRAVILLPSGSTQIWAASPGGTWRQIS
jgi:type IV fimbrial biogenesis protein FimT